MGDSGATVEAGPNVASSVSATQPAGGMLLRYVVGLCDELVTALGRRCGREALPLPALQTTALTQRTNVFGVSYTRGVRAKLEHAPPSEEELGGWAPI